MPAVRVYSRSAPAGLPPVPAPTSLCAPKTCWPHGVPESASGDAVAAVPQRSTATPPLRPTIQRAWVPSSRAQPPTWLRLREVRDEEAPHSRKVLGHERNASRTRAPTSSCAAQGFRDGRRRLSRGFARQGQWTRYDSIRLPDRALAALVQSACNKPGSRQITHDHVRSGHGAWMAGPCRIPKLTVRVRFPSPAPRVKSVAAQSNPAVSLKEVNAHSRPKRHSCHYACPWPSWQVPRETVSSQADSAGPIPVTRSTKSGCSSCSGEELLHCAKAARYACLLYTSPSPRD